MIQVIGPNNVAVPTHFFKIITGVRSNGQVEIQVRFLPDDESFFRYSEVLQMLLHTVAQSFIMPNAVIPGGQPLAQFLVPLEEIEKKAGESNLQSAAKNTMYR